MVAALVPERWGSFSKDLHAEVKDFIVSHVAWSRIFRGTYDFLVVIVIIDDLVFIG